MLQKSSLRSRFPLLMSASLFGIIAILFAPAAQGSNTAYQQNLVNTTGTGRGNAKYLLSGDGTLGVHAFFFQQQNGPCVATPSDIGYAFYLGGQLSNYFYAQQCDGIWFGDGQYHWTMYNFLGNSPCGGFRGPCDTLSLGDWAANNFFIQGGGGGAYLDPQGNVTPALVLQDDTTLPPDPRGLPITVTHADTLVLQDSTTVWSGGTSFIFGTPGPYALSPPVTAYTTPNPFSISRIHIGTNNDLSLNNADGLGNLTAFIDDSNGNPVTSSTNTCYLEGGCSGADLLFPFGAVVPQNFDLRFVALDGIQGLANFNISNIGFYKEEPHPSISILEQVTPDTLVIPEGGTAAGNAMVFNGNLQSSSTDSLVLQVEVEPFVTPFLNIATATSSAVTAGQIASVTVAGLAPGQYHWQARAIDTKTLIASPWQEFGTSGNVDFTLVMGCQVGFLNPPLPYYQFDAPWNTDIYANYSPTEIFPELCPRSQHATIQCLGCALTALSMALYQAGITDLTPTSTTRNDPRSLNVFMRNHIDFDTDNNVDFIDTTLDVSNSLRATTNKIFVFDHTFAKSTSANDLFRAVCTENPSGPVPVIVKVAGTSSEHFVLVTGAEIQSDGTIKFSIFDPGHADKTTLDAYNNQFEISGSVKDPPGDNSNLSLSVGDNGDLLVVDPTGKRTGFDLASNKILEEIPGSLYERNALGSDEAFDVAAETAHSIHIQPVQDGKYIVTITGLNLGQFTLVLRAFWQDASPQPPLVTTGITGPATQSTFQILSASRIGSVTAVNRIATLQGALDDIENSAKLGLINKEDEAEDLSRMIHRADEDEKNHENEEAQRILKEFVSRVKRATPKHISEVAAHVLLDDAKSLLSQISPEIGDENGNRDLSRPRL